MRIGSELEEGGFDDTEGCVLESERWTFAICGISMCGYSVHVYLMDHPLRTKEEVSGMVTMNKTSLVVAIPRMCSSTGL
jgi:hypothetical protein